MGGILCSLGSKESYQKRGVVHSVEELEVWWSDERDREWFGVGGLRHKNLGQQSVYDMRYPRDFIEYQVGSGVFQNGSGLFLGLMDHGLSQILGVLCYSLGLILFSMKFKSHDSKPEHYSKSSLMFFIYLNENIQV